MYSTSKKDVFSKDGQSSVEIHSILPSKNPNYRRLANETFLQNGAHTIDTFIGAVKSYSCYFSSIMRYFVEMPLDGIKSQAPMYTP